MDKLKFEIIINKHSKRIFNYLLKILRSREDAEDILQDVFISFYNKIDTVNEASYLSYLYQTAYHKALNRISSRKKNLDFINKVKNNTASQQIENEPETKNNEIIKEALRSLKPKEAFLLELQFYQKMNYKEIAEIMATSVSAIDSKLVRVKKKLKKIISQKMKNNKVINYRGDNYEQEIRL